MLIAKSPWIPNLPTGKQLLFLTLPDREVFYGGQVGGGKSDALLMGALMFADVPGYNAIIFRRTYPELSQADGLIHRSKQWLAPTQAVWNEGQMRWTFPSGATLRFAHMQREDDKFNYQGGQYQYCVALGTPILMGDGRWLPIEQVGIGDEVATLEGPKRVYATHRPGVKPVTRVMTPYGSALVSSSHRLLTAFGWASPQELASTRSSVEDDTGAFATAWSAVTLLPSQRSFVGHLRTHVLAPRTLLGMDRREAFAYPEDRRSDYARSGDEHPVGVQPPVSYAPLVLSEPALLRVALSSAQRDECCDVSSGCGVANSPDGCHHDVRLHDERFHPNREGALAGTPSLAGAAVHPPRSLRKDGRELVLEHSQAYSGTLCHPYTLEEMGVTEGVRQVFSSMVPEGVAEVADLSVEGASHYVSFPGIISQNCAFDELTGFTETQYTYLLSRLRKLRLSPVPLRVRSASNPGNIGHDWVYERFVIGEHPFIPASLDDNPYLSTEEYKSALAELDDITRAQLLEGKWVQAHGEKPFRREFWRGKNRFSEEESIRIRNRCYGRWIFADTAQMDDEEAAYTVFLMAELDQNYTMKVKEVWRGRPEFNDLPEEVVSFAYKHNRDSKLKGFIVEHASSGIQVLQVLKHTAPDWLKPILHGAKPLGKENGWSQAGVWCKRGMVHLPEPGPNVPWLYDFEEELYRLPNARFKDQGDALAIGVNRLKHYLAERWLAMGAA